MARRPEPMRHLSQEIFANRIKFFFPDSQELKAFANKIKSGYYTQSSLISAARAAGVSQKGIDSLEERIDSLVPKSQR